MKYRYLIALGLLFACGSVKPSETESMPGTDSMPVDSPVGGGDAGSPAGARSGAAPVASTSSPGTSDVPSAPDAAAAGESFDENCLAGAETSCEQCLCTGCTSQLQRCQATPGCPEITECIREHGCEGIACYCGQFDALTCLGGQADGPCKATVLAAPGGRAPTLGNPSGGPATDAALAIGDCSQPGKRCATECGSAG